MKNFTNLVTKNFWPNTANEQKIYKFYAVRLSRQSNPENEDISCLLTVFVEIVRSKKSCMYKARHDGAPKKRYHFLEIAATTCVLFDQKVRHMTHVWCTILEVFLIDDDMIPCHHFLEMTTFFFTKKSVTWHMFYAQYGRCFW